MPVKNLYRHLSFADFEVRLLLNLLYSLCGWCSRCVRILFYVTGDVQEHLGRYCISSNCYALGLFAWLSFAVEFNIDLATGTRSDWL